MKKLLIGFMMLLPSAVFAADGMPVHHYDIKGLIWRIITFIVFIVILYFILRNPIKRFAGNRTQEIESALKDALKANEDAKSQLKDYQEKVAKLETELEEMKANALKVAEKEREMILADIQKTIEKMKQFALNMIEAETLKAKNDLRKELADLASKDAEKRLTQMVKGDKQKEFLEQYIKRIGE